MLDTWLRFSISNCHIEYPMTRLRAELEIPVDDLELIRKKSTLKMVYRGLNNQGPPKFNNLFNEYIPARSLWSEANCLIQPPVRRLKFTENDIAISGCQYWNPLDVNLKRCPSLDMFKSELKKCRQ